MTASLSAKQILSFLPHIRAPLFVTLQPGVGAGRGPISSGTQSIHRPDKCYPSLFLSLRSIRTATRPTSHN